LPPSVWPLRRTSSLSLITGREAAARCPESSVSDQLQQKSPAETRGQKRRLATLTIRAMIRRHMGFLLPCTVCRGYGYDVI